jgi:hypothetical protein
MFVLSSHGLGWSRFVVWEVFGDHVDQKGFIVMPDKYVTCHMLCYVTHL